MDIASTSLTTPSGTATAGQAATLTESFQNESNTAIGPFAVTLYSGDPDSPQLPVTVLATQNVSGLAASASGSVTFNVTIPPGAGNDVYTAVVDSANAIAESNETNNESRFEVDIQADPAIFSPGTGAVTATLLNSSSSNNVQVVVNVENNGPVPLFNVPIDLEDSRNSGAFVSDGQLVIPELDPGTPVVETFTVTALGGDNLFIGSIDSSEFQVDSNLSNNTGVADLFVPGLPTLTATVSLSSGTAVPGQPVTLTANLSNTGIGDAGGVPLVVLASLSSGGPSYMVGTGTANLTGLGSVSVPISLNTTALAAGTYTITLQIDPQQTVVQGSEAGNTVTTTLAYLPVLVGAPVVNGNIPSLVGAQRSMVQDIVYTFSSPVTIPNATGAFSVVGAGPHPGTAPATLAATAVAGSNGTQWAITLTGGSPGLLGSIANGEYSITINPAFVFAASDGVTPLAAGRTDRFYRLFGDINGAEVVNAVDNLALKKAITTYNPAFDSNTDGAVTAIDNLAFKKDLTVAYFGDGFVLTI